MVQRHVVVHLAAGGPGDSFVELDGERVKNCTAITVRGGTREATTVTLELVNVRVDFDGAVEDENISRITETTALGSTSKTWARA